MLSKYSLKLPHVVFSGENALQNIVDIVKNKYNKIALFTDKGIREAGLLKLPLAYLKEAGCESVVIEVINPEPSYEEVQSLIDEFNETNAQFIIAVGGGSVLDTAKLASLLGYGGYKVKDLLEKPQLGKKKIKTLLIPTTAGTGSEATPNSIVAVPEKELKVGIVNEEMIADYIILDAEMIKKLPRKIAAATGVDALAHAIECFTSKKANSFSDTFALEALELIMNNLEKACDNPVDMKAKNAMLIASFYAGIAITASGTTAVHALSYPLGGKYHIPHGISNAMLLVPVMKFNEPLCRERLAKVYDRVVKNVSEMSIEEKAKWIINRLEEIVKHLEIPVSLKDYGVPKEDLESLVKSGMGVERLLINNIREVTPIDARALYMEIL